MAGTTFTIKVGAGGTGGKNNGLSYESATSATNGGDTYIQIADRIIDVFVAAEQAVVIMMGKILDV